MTSGKEEDRNLDRFYNYKGNEKISKIFAFLIAFCKYRTNSKTINTISTNLDAKYPLSIFNLSVS